LKILVVEDQPEHQLWAQHSLRTLGAEFRFANNGAEGLQMALEMRPNIILADIHMPEMDGFELFEALGQQARTRDIPVVFLTAIDDEYSISKAMRNGAFNYLTKPYDAQELLDIVQSIMSREKIDPSLLDEA
jgi:two-component system, sensor histidine kinase and response regulator